MSGKKSDQSRIFIKKTVGVLVVLLLAAYFIFMFVSYKNKKTVSFYEVEEGSLVKEHSYQGIILRQELAKCCEASGYVNFYVADSKKAAMGDLIYSIDETGDLKNFLAAHSQELNEVSSGKIQSVRNTVLNASRTFDSFDFQASADLLNSLNAAVSEFTDTETLLELSEEMKAAGISVVEYRTDTTGIVSYNIDGYEGLERSDVTASIFDRTSYAKKRYSSGELVGEGDPVFKLITDENWEIIFQMTEEDVKEFSEVSKLKINFKDKDLSTEADFSIFRNADGNTYGSLKMKRYVVWFLSDRYVDFEIETNNVSGLKIPEKSITEADFHIIPSSYRQKDSRGNAGFYKEILTEGGTGYVFLITEIYCDDGENCYVRLPASGELQEGDYIVDPENSERRYRIGPTGSLKGVYNINKGYAVFKRIEELERANGYCIIKKGSSYGLSVYDHIVLDAETVEEGQVLY